MQQGRGQLGRDTGACSPPRAGDLPPGRPVEPGGNRCPMGHCPLLSGCPQSKVTLALPLYIPSLWTWPRQSSPWSSEWRAGMD